MKTMKYFNLFLTIAIMGLLYSCYPKGAEYVDELDVVISKYDSDNFKVGTFAMPDSVVYLKDGKLDEEHPHDKDGELLSQIEDGFSTNGFELVDEVDDNTAFIVVVEVLESTNVGYIWPPYGGWYPWYPGGYYPWYPWGPSYYSYQTGTVRVHLGDWKNRDEANDKIKYVYLGAINGLMQGSSSYIDARVKAGIDQLFSQAPFPIPAN